MADIIYTVNQDSPENIKGFEQYSQEDRELVSSFQINNRFSPTKNYSELHILSLSDELIESIYDYTGFAQLGNAQSAGQDGASVITIDPVRDIKFYGYDGEDVKLLYHFLNDLYSQDNTRVEFYIQDISADRTELSLATLNKEPKELAIITSAIKSKLREQSYFTGFRLNFKENDLLIATNIDTLDSPTGKVVVVKLYEPLPITYKVKSTLSIVDIVSDSIAYEIDAEFIIPPVQLPTLKSPNFNIDIIDYNIIPTGYSNYNELFSYPINNSNSQIFSAVNEKSIDISVDYSDYSKFVHFSSAQERLLNFKYKVDLVEGYSASLATIATATTGLQGVSGSRDYYQALLTGVVSNFDHYERYLYYESGSDSWPKSNTTKPYSNKKSTTQEAITWYSDQITNAIYYDQTNNSSLIYSIPSFLRDDTDNENYLTFVFMVGQHFDNLWLYSKAVTDKYDADNRIDHGISKDLVAEALKNFGVKLYTSNKSIEDLFTTFIGQAYQSGSEKINVYVTGSLTGSNASIQPTSYDIYQKEVQKRIYHNLPLLLKSKGTERGVRALINCLGIPGDILDIKVYGGRNTNERPFFGDSRFYSSSLDKIRLDNTGSIVTGSTLSEHTSIIRRDNKYTDDLHPIEVGFAPVDSVDNYIITNITGSFNLEDYIGDPGHLTSSSYKPLDELAKTLLTGSLGTASHYNLQDYIRLIKFYDNTIFKMVKDFIPARALADTGIIIKPNLLNRSKAKSVTVIGTRPEHSASIETTFISGSNAKSFGIDDNYDTRYSEIVQTPLGLGVINTHFQQEVKFDGEFSGSLIAISTQNLNIKNPYKYPEYEQYPYNLHYWSSSVDFCFLPTTASSFFIRPTDGVVNFLSVFTGTNSNTQLTLSSVNQPTITITNPYTIPAYGTPFVQYEQIYVTASNGIVQGAMCSSSVSMSYGICEITTNPLTGTQVIPATTLPPTTYDLSSWFTINPVHTHLTYFLTGAAVPTGTNVAAGTSVPSTIPGVTGGTVTLQVVDTFLENCLGSVTLNLGVCNLSQQLPTPPQTQFEYTNRSDTFTSVFFEKNRTPLPGLGTLFADRGFRSYFLGETDNTLYTVQALYPQVQNSTFTIITRNPNLRLTIQDMIVLAEQRLVDFGYGPPDPGEEGMLPIFLIFAEEPGILGCNTDPVIVVPIITGCFVKGTAVTMADGIYTPIEDVEEGDSILTYNEVTKEQKSGLVEKVQTYNKDNIVLLHLSNGTKIEVTTEHPFWVINKGWCSVNVSKGNTCHTMKISQLQVQDSLLDENNNEVVLLEIQQIENNINQIVYNLTVEGNHTYYANSILVHNKPHLFNPVAQCYFTANSVVIFCTDALGNIIINPT